MLSFPRNLWLERPAEVQGGGPAEAINWVEVFSKKNNKVVVQQRLSTVFSNMQNREEVYSTRFTLGWLRTGATRLSSRGCQRST